MDLTDYKAIEREVEFTLPNGEPTGFYLRLRYESSDEVQRVQRKFRAKLVEVERKGRNANRKQVLENFEMERRIAHVAGWRWTEDGVTFNGEQPEFSPEKLKEFLTYKGDISVFLKAFIDDEVGDASDFLERSEDNSETASGGTQDMN